MSDKEKKSYKDTLCLPATSFAMKANLVQREPAQRKEWEKGRIYEQILDSRKDAPLYVLHDGPPYANGDIHMGHVINKVLKDFVVKYKTMAGFRCPYIPGWDCHGLPIEVKVMAELGQAAKEMSKPEFRRHCKKYASKYVKLQSRQFQSLGIFGDFENPYLTLKPSYEQGILEIFAELVGNGLVYKQLKPIHWSVGCETALADAELEYKDIASPSIYVNFPLDEPSAAKVIRMGLAEGDHQICFMIWTTTPWTLTANLAVALHPLFDYVCLSYEKDSRKLASILAKSRLQAVINAAGLQPGEYKVSEKSHYGTAFKDMRYIHPFLEKNPTNKDCWFAINEDFVTTEDGTGIVHIAPGHGAEDYRAGMNNEMAVYSPVCDDGTYDDTVPAWLAGKSVLKVDKEIIEHLKKTGLLVKEDAITHSYPHCWRSKMPVVFRATEQWFINVDEFYIENPSPDSGGWKEQSQTTLRNRALAAIKKVKWIPAWGQKRIQGMLESRPDWCISRQRVWGLPIPAFINGKGRALLNKESVLAVAKYIGQKGSDAWFTDSPKEILGEDFVLPEGFDWDDLKKEENIFDVWFESGCSWHSVVEKAGLPVPVDMYLEGSDQHRGWFQLSLLPALGSIGKAPFKTVLTHGFTVDQKGVKQSKSAGNYVSAIEEIEKYGADILRLWVASVNYQEDMRCSDELIGRLQEASRKMRNTLRYLRGSVDDFDPAVDAVAYEKMLPIDRWAVEKLTLLIGDVKQAYENFAFHRVFALIYNFCTVEMSSVYMDALKDRMYCDGKKSRRRRSGQSAMQVILDALVRMLAPILVHTAQEAWAAMKHKSQPVVSVHTATFPDAPAGVDAAGQAGMWEKVMKLRDEALKATEGLRSSEAIGSNQEATVRIVTDDAEAYESVMKLGLEDFAALCIVSEVQIEKGDSTKAAAEKSPCQKCQRCWNYRADVGKISGYPDLCGRCADVVRG